METSRNLPDYVRDCPRTMGGSAVQADVKLNILLQFQKTPMWMGARQRSKFRLEILLKNGKMAPV